MFTASFYSSAFCIYTTSYTSVHFSISIAVQNQSFAVQVQPTIHAQYSVSNDLYMNKGILITVTYCAISITTVDVHCNWHLLSVWFIWFSICSCIRMMPFPFPVIGIAWCYDKPDCCDTTVAPVQEEFVNFE